MKPAAPLPILAIFAMVAAGCSVRRLSTDFECVTDLECASTRTCDRGYCVERTDAGPRACPDPCTSCDLAAMTCQIECSASKPCEIRVLCPAGFACTISCSDHNACQDIDCMDAGGCDITCSGAMACGSINCGDGPCTAACNGPQACADVSCGTSCKCDVQCTGAPTSACPTSLCPFNANFDYCAKGGMIGALCDSTEPQCNVCPVR